MTRRPPATRWEPCLMCRRVREPGDLIGAEDVFPERSRGYVCDPAGAEPCRFVTTSMRLRIRRDLDRRLS